MLGSSSHPERAPTLSPETVRALKYYKHEVAAYTLRQWNNAKIESERKERDRIRRRADLLAQRAAAAAVATASSPKTAPATHHHQHHHHAVRGVSDSSSDPRRPSGASGMHMGVAGTGLGKSRTSGNNENENGPLMMVSRRRSERAQTTITQAPRSSYGAGSAHLPAPAPVLPHYPRHQTAAPVVQSTIGKHHQLRAHEPHRSQHQRHKSHSPARHGALDQTSNLPSYAFDRPTIHHLESVLATLDLDEPHRPSASASASTPPIPIPPRTKEEQDQDEDSPMQSVPSNISSPSSSSSHTRPARVLGFAAHLGMTSISNDDAKSSIASSSVCLTDSASTSNPTSEESSRMGSFSETGHALHNVPIALKDVSEDTPMADDLDAWPIKMYDHGIRVQGDDEHVFGPLEHH